MKTSNLISFAAGAIIGSVAAVLLVRKKYEKIAQEEINSVKEYYYNERVNPHFTDTDGDTPGCPVMDNENKEVYKQYAEKLSTNEYTPEVKNEDVKVEPFVITPDEFGEWEEFKLVSLTYFSGDKILADDRGIVYNIANVGEDCLTQFGEWEDNYVHVRNNELETDYEILLDERNYSEVWEK